MSLTLVVIYITNKTSMVYQKKKKKTLKAKALREKVTVENQHELQ